MSSEESQHEIFRYEIDGADCITFVCPNWLKFAADNATPGLDAASVIGQPIWRYIADMDCRRLYKDLFSHIRQNGTPAVFPFRCDSSTIKRFMEMRVTQLQDDHLRFHSTLVSEESQPYCPLLDPDRERSNSWVTMCAWCKQVRDPQGRWIDVVESVQALAPFANAGFPNLSHGICPPCQQSFLDSVGDPKAK